MCCNDSVLKVPTCETGYNLNELSVRYTGSLVRDDGNISYRSAEPDHDTPLILLAGPCNSCIDLAWSFHRKALLPEWGSVLTPSQWAGRGQFGREWLSPVGNLYAALRLPLLSGRLADMASLLMGYLMVKGLESQGVAAQLKWPNDILVNGKKTGGILIEERAGVLIAGVGINLVSSPSDRQLRSPDAISAGILNQDGYNFRPLSLWRSLVKNARDLYSERIRCEGADALINDIHSCMAFIGAKVRIVGHSFPGFEAEVLGLAPDGGLKILTLHGVEIIRSAGICP